MAHNHEHAMESHITYTSQGYEGIVIKKISNGAATATSQYKESLYKAGYCNHILKYKDFKDAEALILSIEDGNIFKVQDSHNNIFHLPSPITADATMINKYITYRYQHLTNQGLPHSPSAIAIRDYE